MSWPKEYGGQDLLLSYLGLLFEEAGRHLASLPMLGTLVSALILARHGSAAQRATMRCDAVRVPLSDRVGTPAAGRAIALELMDLAAAFTTALMVGAAGEATRRAVEYAKQRHAFGQPIGVDGAREAVSRLALGQPASVEVSQAKAFANEKCLMAVRMAQQLHGGIGFIAEFDQQLWYHRIASWSLRCGTAPEHRARVAEALLDRPGPVRLGYEISPDEEGSEMAARQHA